MNAYTNDRQMTITQAPWILIIFTLASAASIGVLFYFGQSWQIGLWGVAICLVLLAIFGEITTCTLDQDLRMVRFKRLHLWKSGERELRFDEINTVAVESSRSDGSTTYRVSFVLKSGEKIPLTNYYSSGRKGKQRQAQKISDFISATRFTPVEPALDGSVTIEHEGETDGIHWEIDFITAEGRSPITRWHAPGRYFSHGYMLVIPAATPNMGTLPTGGLLGKAISFFYKQYLGTMGFDSVDGLSFENTVILNDLGPEDFTVVTDNPSGAHAWFTPEVNDRLTNWMEDNPLFGDPGETHPHILATPQGLWITLLEHFTEDQDVEAIARFGTSLAQSAH